MFWLTVPTVMLPYLALFALASIFFSTRLPFFEFIMDSVFGGNALNLLAAVLIYCILAASLSIIYFAAGLRKEWDALLLAKSAMIVKLIQVPAYVFIFALGVVFLITLFTIPFSVALFLIDCLTLVLTGLMTVSAVINAIRQGAFKSKEVIWIIILQLVFCADVVSTIVFYNLLKKRCKSETQ